MPVKKICVVCNKEFKVPPSRADKAKTCSQKCRGVLIAQSYSEARVKLKCRTCGKLIEVPASRAKRGNGKFCSNQCRNESMVGKPFTPLASDGDTQSHSGGYVLEYCKLHPFSVRGMVMQHRLVMERWMRKECPDHPFLIDINGELYLDRKIHVHHKNEIKDYNRRRNLVACTSSGHRDMHGGRTVMKGETWPVPEETIQAEPRIIWRNCETCGKSFGLKRSTALRSAHKYCSRECSSGYSGDLPSKIDRVCLECGKKFVVTRSVALKGHGKYCSNDCRHKAKKGVSSDYKQPYK